MKIYLIRHGETKWNTEGRFQGKTDTELTETGVGQALRLSLRLKDVGFDAIYSSPLRRAACTAAPLAESKGLGIIVRDELKELDFGHWEGLTFEEIRKKHPEEYIKCRKDPYTHGFRYGLPYEDVKQTVTRFIDECIHSRGFKKIAVVSHSAVLKMLITVYLELPPNFIHNLFLENCSVSVIDAENGRNVILKLNDTGEIT